MRDYFGHCCAYCQTAESLTVVTFEVEHILPRSLGGLTECDNLCLACPSCNRHKSNRLVGITSDGVSTLPTDFGLDRANPFLIPPISSPVTYRAMVTALPGNAANRRGTGAKEFAPLA